MMDTIMNTATKLDPREEHFPVASPHPDLSLFLRYLAPPVGGDRHVLYVHGGTFPSALSIAHRASTGRVRGATRSTKRDSMSGASISTASAPPTATPRWPSPPRRIRRSAAPPIARASSRRRCASCASGRGSGGCRWSRIPGARSCRAPSPGDAPSSSTGWSGSAPIARRDGRKGERTRSPGWRLVSPKDQWIDRFAGRRCPARRAGGAVAPAPFRRVGQRPYLEDELDSRTRNSPADGGKVPSAVFQDIYDAWASARLLYDPGQGPRPDRGHVRGEWGQPLHRFRCAVAVRHFTRIRRTKRDVKIGRATHLMHLEENRASRSIGRRSVFTKGGDR